MTSTSKNADTKKTTKKKVEIDNTEIKEKKSVSKKKTDEAMGNEATTEEKAEQSSSDNVNDELAVERDKYLRLAAEYKNFRDRSTKERDKIYSDARMDTIAKLLPVYDNLERALKMECTDEAFYKGVEMTMIQLMEIFENMDVKPIPAVGEPFDPNHHNAVMTVENPELGSKIVAEELQKGFMLGDKVIRFSTVIVAN